MRENRGLNAFPDRNTGWEAGLAGAPEQAKNFYEKS
jgi:hypothetical protein